MSTTREIEEMIRKQKAEEQALLKKAFPEQVRLLREDIRTLMPIASEITRGNFEDKKREYHSKAKPIAQDFGHLFTDINKLEDAELQRSLKGRLTTLFATFRKVNQHVRLMGTPLMPTVESQAEQKESKRVTSAPVPRPTPAIQKKEDFDEEAKKLADLLRDERKKEDYVLEQRFKALEQGKTARFVTYSYEGKEIGQVSEADQVRLDKLFAEKIQKEQPKEEEKKEDQQSSYRTPRLTMGSNPFKR